MNVKYLFSLFEKPAKSECVEELFSRLGIYNRPEISDDQEYVYHDWVLARRKGIELGFSDANYHAAADRYLWGTGELLFTQVYFYSGFDDIEPYTGELPFGLAFMDDREAVRAKLIAFEGTRHSYLNDTWDVGDYRLSVAYNEGGASIDRIACRVLAKPIPRHEGLAFPTVRSLASAFDQTVDSRVFLMLWNGMLSDAALQEADEIDEIDLTQTYGASLDFAESDAGAVFRAITLHRNRDMESAGWGGELPQGLDFDDDPQTLFNKINTQPAQQSDSELTGHAVWHFDDYTLYASSEKFVGCFRNGQRSKCMI